MEKYLSSTKGPAEDAQARTDKLWAQFEAPAAKKQTRPLWFWNDSLANTTKEEIRKIMEQSKAQSGYFGFAILPNWIDRYLSEEYMELYGYALDVADELGMTMILYDENGWPSGQAGGLLAKQHPESTYKRLDKVEERVVGPAVGRITLPEGEYRTYIGAVAMNTETKEILDLSDRMEYDLPEGEWQVMSFATVKDGYPCVDYLDPDAVQDYIDVTFEAYYSHFPDHFGTTIDTAFYDEPGLYHAGGRSWTGRFNQMFKAEHGYNPITLYPALWYDIGENTAAARNALFGFRAKLYGDYIRKVDAWCTAHGIRLTGHQDQEEPLNPTGLTGDLMQVFEQQAIPGVDDIVNRYRSLKVYKIISSAANNYDKPLVMSESFGAMGEGVGITAMYKDTMEQFAKGINFIIPHAIWHNNREHIDNPPELSYRSQQYGPKLAAYNQFVGRLQTMLQGGRHVADIALLYPIDSLQSSTRLDAGDPYLGGVTPAEADYMQVGELLMTSLYKDYTYLHPDVLAQKTTIQGDMLRLDNEVNQETYKVLILPGQSVISLAALRQAKAFYDAGGKVVATTRLPHQSAEFGGDAEVTATMEEMFGVKEADFYPQSETCNTQGEDLSIGPTACKETSNAAGGKAIFLGADYAAGLKEALAKLCPVYDVEIDGVDGLTLQDGNFCYLHKVKGGRDLYYFSNASDTAFQAKVTVRQEMRRPMLWDPHAGTRQEPDSYTVADGVTTVRFAVDSVHSYFLLDEAQEPGPELSEDLSTDGR